MLRETIALKQRSGSKVVNFDLSDLESPQTDLK